MNYDQSEEKTLHDIIKHLWEIRAQSCSDYLEGAKFSHDIN